MTPAQLLDALREAGVSLWLEDGGLRYRAPKGALTPELRAGLAAQKEALLSVLGEDVAPVASPRGPRSVASFAQEGMWFLTQLEPTTCAYNIPLVLRVTGLLDVAILHQALGELVRRHEALRTTFASENGRVFQVCHEPSALNLTVEDLGALPENDRRSVAEQHIAAEAQQPFSLEEGPLFRTSLLRLSSVEHLLLITVHHIVSDGWSTDILLKELGVLYQAFQSARPPSLPPPQWQYADFALWERQYLQGRVLDRQVGYWKEKLAGAALLAVPTDRPHPAKRTSNGRTLSFELSPKVVRALCDLGREHGATLFMTLMASFHVLLHRYTGQSDISVGTAVTCRQRAEFEDIVGLFVNTLVIRSELPPAATFIDVLGRVKEACLGAYAHQDLPFARVVEEIGGARDQSRNPLFQVMLTLDRVGERGLDTGGGPTMETLEVEHRLARFDLSLAFTEQGEMLTGCAEYSCDLFDAPRIRRLTEHFGTLLEGITATPAIPVRDLPLLGAEERARLFGEWNTTASPLPSEGFFHTLVEAQAAQTPEATAISTGAATVSYSELDGRASRLARFLRVIGVGPDVRVAMYLERSEEMVTCALAIAKAGGVYVPLDPAYPVQRLGYLLVDCEPHVVLTQSSLKPALEAALGQNDTSAVAPRVLDVNMDRRLWEAGPKMNSHERDVGVSSTNLAYIIYTSGSTGQPKGVMVEHRGLVNYLGWARGAYAPRDGAVVSSSFAFDATVTSMLTPLICGGEVRLLPEGDELAGLDAQLRRGRRCGLIKITPTLMNAAAQTQGPGGSSIADDLVVVGGEALSRGAVDAWRRFRPRSRIVNEYGPTEATVGCVVYDVPSTEELPAAIPIGRPIANTQIYLLDRNGRPVPIGVVGEIYIGGHGVARGYWNRPDLTAERFVPDPFGREAGARLYRTGDLARYLDDGNIEYLGRLDFQVKLRGFRIELGEVETKLREHPQVQDAVVLMRDAAGLGGHLVAYYTLHGAIEADALRAHLSASLPEYMVPTAYVALDAFPVTVNGKLDRSGLPDPASEPLAGDGYSAPAGELETELAQLWAEVLNVERVGRCDNFFELGGHSLVAMVIVSQIRTLIGVDLPLGTLLEWPTVAELAAEIERRCGVTPAVQEPPGIKPAPRTGRIPLSFSQERLWFLDKFNPGNAAYNIPLALRLHGDLDVETLRRSFEQLVARHEILRTTIASNGDSPMQVVHPPGAWRLPVTPLKGETDAERRAQVEELALAEGLRPFSLERGPMLRTSLLRVSDVEHVLLITMHHIVSDGWSTEVLAREVGTFYDALLSGRSPSLTDLPVQYADFAIWQRGYLEGDVLTQQLDYWREQLAGAAVLDLPTDRPRPPAQTYRGTSEEFGISAETAAGLRALSLQHDATLFMTLMAAFQVLLYRHTGQEDISIGTPIANRTRRETHGLIGFFLNTLVLRADLSGAPRFVDVLERVKQTALGAYAHQDLPFERLVRDLEVTRDESRHPLFQVMFTLQGPPPIRPALLSGLTCEAIKLDEHISKFDLTLSFADHGDDLVGWVQYNTDLFDRDTIQRLIARLQTLLAAVVASPEARIGDVPILSEWERKRILEEWNAAGAPVSGRETIHRLFAEQATKTPHAVALTYEDQELTYQDLDRRANQLAHHLQGLGVAPEAMVGLCVDRSPEMVVGLLGILKAGAAYVPMDPEYPIARVDFMLADAGVAIVVTQSRHNSLVGGASRRCVHLDTDWASIEANFPADRVDAPPEAAGAGALAYVIYTSGSTGRPKGVMVTHANVTRLFESTRRWFGFGASDVWTLFHSYAFDFSVWEIWGALLHGGRLVIVRSDIARSPAEFCRLVCREGVTVLNQTPSAFRQLTAAAGDGDRHQLRFLIFGGESLDVGILGPWYRKNRGRDTQLINMYGITETTVHVTFHRLDESQTKGSTGSPIGERIPDLRIYVLDARAGLVPVGVVGELFVGGNGVARGYLNRPDLTAERFVPDPFASEPGARMYRTGDSGRWRWDGTVEHRGRNDGQIKLRGFRIELGEIEARLSEQEGIREAVVVPREDDPEDMRLVAYLVAEPTARDTSALRGRLKAVLPEHMLPAAFVFLDALPLTPNGKLDRTALPAPDDAAYARGEYEEPLGDLEETIARVWSDVLGIDRVGRRDNFFELGGHSLLAVKVAERLQHAGILMEVRTLFGQATVESLAAATGPARATLEVGVNGVPTGCKLIAPEMLRPLLDLTAEEIDRVVAAVPGGAENVQDIYPLGPLQEGIFFHHLMSQQGDPYVVRTLRSFDTRQRLEAYLAALRGVIDRHDILRTSVHWEGLSEPVQVVWRQAPLVVEEVSLDEGVDAQQALLHRFDPRQYRLDVRRAPMLRIFTALDVERGRWLALELAHHFCIDNTAEKAMHREIVMLLRGEAHRLPASIPFRRLVAQARLGMSQQEHEAFFRRTLSDIVEPTAPFGLDDVHGEGTEIREASLEVTGSLGPRIRERARKLGVSPASVFHLAWAQALVRITGRRDVVFGTVLFGRMNSAAGERSLGLFINTLPLRVAVDGESVKDSVRRVHADLGDLLRHEHASLALAQRCSGVPAPRPLFSSLLNYRHGVDFGSNTPGPDEPSPQEDGSEFLAAEERTNYPLTLSIDDLGTSYWLKAQVSRPIEPERVCALMQAAIEQTVKALESQPSLPLRYVDVLPETEGRRLLLDWSGVDAERPREACIHGLFEAQARQTPDAVALVFDGVASTYAGLDSRANQLANHLRALGVGPETLVGVCLERSTEMVIGLLAILKAGGAYLPLDPIYPAARLAFMLRDSGATVVCTHSSLASRFAGLTAATVLLDQQKEEIAACSTELPPSATKPEHLAYVIYTSGSTGTPKGAAIEHRSAAALIEWATTTYSLADLAGVLAATSISFDLSVFELFVPLAVGGTVHLARTVLDVAEFGHQITLINTVPSAMRTLLGIGAVPPSVRVVNLAGEPLANDLVQALYALEHVKQVYDLYGPTEATTYSTFALRERGPNSVTTIGRPIRGTEVYILDTDLRPVPIGATGDILLGGCGLARGYLNRPDLTAEHFVPSPWNSSVRLYRTGDRARFLPDGNIQLLGRTDNQVKVRGFRIELGEIETALTGQPDVREAAVLANDDARGGMYLVAYVVARVTDAADAVRRDDQDLKRRLKDQLPPFSVPDTFVYLDALPLTPNGKIDRKALAQVNSHPLDDGGYVAPRTPLEASIAEIWGAVLGLEPIGIHTNFFNAGGHSLLATRAVSRLRERVQLEVPLASIFKFPTVAELAEHVAQLRQKEQEDGEQTPRAPSIKPGDRLQAEVRTRTAAEPSKSGPSFT